ncbi:MAG TPA: hypothetical protein VJP06_06630, partial [Thermoplasmata archaeon]|nr:hypothetical protein [Thermoplasmata archaeon]
MSLRVEDLPACASCGGKLFPLVLCETCGAASILHDADRLDPSTACPECGSPDPWQLICDQCHSRFPAPDAPAESPPAAALISAAEPTARPAASRRKKRHLRAELDTTALSGMLGVLGLDPSRAQALIDRGYNALWKIARVREADLARIPEVGPLAARKIFASFDLLSYSPPQQTRESILQEECDCPLCGCRTSAFAPTCLECGADFDEEEMDEELRSQFAKEGDETLLAFYDGRLTQSPDDPGLLFGRGLLLEAMGRFGDAFEALDRASSKAPDSKEIKVAVLRVQAKRIQRPGQAEALRSTATALLDDAAWDQEVAQLDNLIARPERACPECGVALPDGAARCPSCGALVAGPPEAETVKPSRPRESPELDLLVDDLLVGELERSLSPDELDKTKAAVLDWLIQELEDSLQSEEKLTPVATPETKIPRPVAPESSPLAASVGFLSRWMEGSRGLSSGKPPSRGVRDTLGKVNGLVNGVGRVNGLVNGLGRVNGLATSAGRVNGLATPRGRVNGLVAPQGRTNGFVNGTRFVRSGGGRTVRFPQPSARLRYGAILSGTLVAIVIFGLLFIPIPNPSGPISIDGSFSDWNSVPMLTAATAAADANVTIAKYASLLDADSLYLFASTVGGMFADSARYDGMYFLIDSDGNASTGFQFNGLGADALVEIFGGNHTVVGARLYSFPADSEVNWSRRQPGGSVQAAASRDGLEAKVSTSDLNGFVRDAFRVAVYSDDFRGASSRSLADLSSTAGAILLNAVRLTSIVGTGPTPLFQIDVHALGIGQSDRWNVSNFELTATFGVAVSLSAESVILTQGQPNATVTASVSAPGFLSGDVIQVNVLGALVPRPVFVEGSPVPAYVLAPRSGIRIDGLFADWVGRDVSDSDVVPVTDSNVDIVRSGAAVNQSAIFFHVTVAGDLFAGQVPQRIIPSGP